MNINTKPILVCGILLLALVVKGQLHPIQQLVSNDRPVEISHHWKRTFNMRFKKNLFTGRSRHVGVTCSTTVQTHYQLFCIKKACHYVTYKIPIKQCVWQVFINELWEQRLAAIRERVSPLNTNARSCTAIRCDVNLIKQTKLKSINIFCLLLSA